MKAMFYIKGDTGSLYLTKEIEVTQPTPIFKMPVHTPANMIAPIGSVPQYSVTTTVDTFEYVGKFPTGELIYVKL